MCFASIEYSPQTLEHFFSQCVYLVSFHPFQLQLTYLVCHRTCISSTQINCCIKFLCLNQKILETFKQLISETSTILIVLFNFRMFVNLLLLNSNPEQPNSGNQFRVFTLAKNHHSLTSVVPAISESIFYFFFKFYNNLVCYHFSFQCTLVGHR